MSLIIVIKGDRLHPVAKIVIGAILLIGGVAWTYYYLTDFISILKGIIGPIVALVGLFVVWLELDELKIEKELASEEKKSRKRK